PANERNVVRKIGIDLNNLKVELDALKQLVGTLPKFDTSTVGIDYFNDANANEPKTLKAFPGPIVAATIKLNEVYGNKAGHWPVGATSFTNGQDPAKFPLSSTPGFPGGPGGYGP